MKNIYIVSTYIFKYVFKQFFIFHFPFLVFIFLMIVVQVEIYELNFIKRIIKINNCII